MVELDDNNGAPRRTVVGRTRPKGTSTTRRGRGWRPRWQGVVRIGLLIGLVAFGTVVFSGIQQRQAPEVARVIDRLDANVVISSTGTELVQIVGGEEDLSLRASKREVYDDGSIRFFEVRMQDHLGLDLTGAEASVEDGKSDWTISGDVRLTVDGWVVHTGTLVYATEQSLLTMEDETGPTTLEGSGLKASGRRVVYTRDRAVYDLRGTAQVSVLGDDHRAPVDIRSQSAVLAHEDGHMQFDGGTEVKTGAMVLESENASAHFGEEEAALERIELRGHARIHSTEPASGGLREMAATDMTLVFDEAARVLERATLAGGSTIELVGSGGTRGARVSAATMDVTMPDGGDVTALEAWDGVRLRLPDTADDVRQEIRAGSLTPAGGPGAGMTQVRFEQDVEYRERRTATSTATAVNRVIRAQRLEAGVEEGLSALVSARFLGNVRFEDDTREMAADEVVYDLTRGVVELRSVGAAGRTPSVTDATSRIDAATIELAVDGSRVAASGGVTSVLTPGSSGDPGGNDTAGPGTKLPGLLDTNQEVLARAEALQYDGDTGQTTYTGQARLWQGDTSFAGDTVTMNDQTGSLAASGSVRTSIQLGQLNETTGAQEVSRTDVEAGTFVYDDTAHHAVYATKALLRSVSAQMAADTIEVFLEADGRTLERLVATGDVKLGLEDGRWASGQGLVYYEVDGRYEMEGAPVVLEEEVEPEEAETSIPVRPGATSAPPSCRRIEGRALTFDRSSDTVTVDGREELRTQTTSGTCTPPVF